MAQIVEPDSELPIERHPWPPFMPANAKVLFLGTFPPAEHRWSMDFYYPNPTNDFWRIMGLLFCGDKNALWLSELKQFDLNAIKTLMARKGIALNDTARAVRRLKGNASDKFLEIVEPVIISDLLAQIPDCRDVVATGEKAAGVVADQLGVDIPKMGHCVASDSGITLWRMPSSSRAYPLSLEKKAACYEVVLRAVGCL